MSPAAKKANPAAKQLEPEPPATEFCPEPGDCFPHGIPADATAAGCVHGTWDLTE